MSNFICEKCGVEIIDSPEGYLTECEHYPLIRETLSDQYFDPFWFSVLTLKEEVKKQRV